MEEGYCFTACAAVFIMVSEPGDASYPFFSSYMSWRHVVLRALSVKSKTRFINGKVVKPDPADPTFMQWERCDDMVTSWILNCLSPDLRDSLQYVNNAKDLWEGALDVTGYYTKMKKLWEEMNTLDVNSQCTCVSVVERSKYIRLNKIEDSYIF
ncbi:uncharacterized protein LOC125813630 [Solanum verrucosum]|uniref:uncharacterized protein LOC125813630 n=1 Tax=Solanum verrucosum TaxID=315347 RepID=UPI0020D1704F|nr:uncharacterized protein LOC125813630 [Solanum verrucosum]